MAEGVFLNTLTISCLNDRTYTILNNTVTMIYIVTVLFIKYIAIAIATIHSHSYHKRKDRKNCEKCIEITGEP